jgi:AcrR family transcriptional regulator
MTPQRQLSPRQQEKRQHILDAALSVFSGQGYRAASMDAIALEAGVSKPTLYTYFGSKEALFETIMANQRDFMLESFERVSADMVSDLHEFAWHYADIVMKPEFLSLARLTIGEAQRFPEIGRSYQAAGPDRLLQGIMAYLKRSKAKGLLAFSDAELAAQDLWALILSAPRNKALHMPDEVPGRYEVRRYVENGLRIFLKAYSTAPDMDLKRLEEVISGTSWNGDQG